MRRIIKKISGIGFVSLLLAVDVLAGGVRMSNAPLVPIAQGDALYASLGSTSQGVFGRKALAPDIIALADAIKLMSAGTPDSFALQAFAYVKSEITPEFRFGLSKGGLGALLDKAGTPFDQAQLLKELLQTQSITANYVFGKVTLTAAQFSSWTGITTAKEACRLLANGGIPAQINGVSPVDCNLTGALTSVSFSHVWLSVSAGANNFLLDPSFKAITYKAPQNLVTLTGYERANFNAAVVDTDGKLNISKLNTKLASLATTSYQTIKASHSGKSTLDVLGGSEISDKELNVIASDVTALGYSGSPITVSAAIPDKLRTKMVFTYLVNPALSLPEQSFTFFADETYGGLLKFYPPSHPNTFYSSSGTLPCVMAYEDSTGQVLINTRHFALNNVRVTVDHPYLAAADQQAQGTWMDTASQFAINCRMPTLFLHGFGVAGDGLLNRHKQWVLEQRELAALSAAEGNPRFSDFTLGWQQVIPTLGTYLYEQSERVQFLAGLSRGHIENHHTVGFVSQPVKIDKPAGAGDVVTQQSLELSLDTAMSFASREASAVIYPDDIEAIPDELIPSAGCTWSLSFSQAGVVEVYSYSCGTLTKTLTTSGGFTNCSLAAGSGYSVTGNCTSFQLWKKYVSATPPSTAYPVNPNRTGVGRALSWFLASLEGEVTQKISGGAYAYSTAHRFVWGADKTAFGIYAGVNAIPKPKLSIFTSPDPSSIFIYVDENANVIANNMVQEANALKDKGYKIVMPGLAIMGPGELSWARFQNPCTAQFCIRNTTYTGSLGSQYGSAFYAENLKNGDFIHYMLDYYGANRGGGSGTRGAPTLDGGKLEAPKPDGRQKLEHGVQKNTGDVSYTFNAVLSTGGDFPYGLSADIQVKTRKSAPEFTATLAPKTETGRWSRIQRNFDIVETGSASFEADGVNLLGKRSPLESAYAVAAAVALLDSSHSGSVRMHLLNAGIAKWFADQTLESTLTVASARGSDEFIRHADGKYYPAPSSPVKAVVSLNVQYVSQTDGTNCSSSAPPNSGNIEWLKSGIARVVSGSVTRTLKNGDKETFAPRNYTTSRWDCGAKNPWNPLTTYNNNKGVTVSYTYDQFKQLTGISNSLGRNLTFTQGGDPTSGYTLSITDGSGRTASVSEDIANNAVKVTLPTQKVWTAKFANPVQAGKATLRGQALDAIYAPMSSTYPIIKYSYNPLWQAVAVTLRKDTTTDWANAYQWGFLPGYANLEVDSATGKALEIYDRKGNVIYQRNPRGVTTLAQYNPINQLKDKRIFEGVTFKRAPTDGARWDAQLPNYTSFEQKETYTYDANSNVTHEVLWPAPNKPGSTSLPLVTERTWHSTYNQLLTETFRFEQGGAKTIAFTNQYDSATGNLTSTTDATGLVTTFENYWNGLPKLVKEGTAGSVYRKRDYVFDSYANLTGYTIKKGDDTSPISTSATYVDPVYGNLGDVVSLTDPRGKVTRATYRADRKIGNLTNPLQAKSAYTYNDNGYLTGIETTGVDSKKSATTAGYNPLGWLTSLTDQAGDTQTFEYDARGLLETKTDGKGRKTRYTYNLLGKLVCQRDGFGTPLMRTYKHIRYNALGSPTTYNSADSDPDDDCALNNTTKQTELTYNAFGQLYRTTFPATPENGITFEQLEYRPSGAIKTRTTRRGDVITYNYKNSNAHPSLLDSKQVGTGQAPGYLVSYVSYDLFGKPTKVVQTGAHANTLDFTYDFADRGVKTETLKIGTDVARTLTSNYDAAGNRSQLIWPDNYTIDYTYSDINKLDQVKAGSVVLADYGDDSLGRTTSISYANGVSTGLGYENDGDLDYVSHSFVGGTNNLRIDYDYNTAAQLTRASYSNGLYHWRTASTQTQVAVPNNLNQYTSVGGVTLGYDKAGNLTQGRTGSFTYDAENKLTNAAMGASNPQGTLTALYSYDANGRRIRKTVTPSGGSSTTTDYLSDGDHEVAEYLPNSTTPLKRFIYGKNVDEIIAQHEPATNSYSYAHRNHQGSVIAVSKAGGQVASSDIYTYSPYGEPNITTGFAYRYTGRRLDAETGLYYYRARYYDAQLGRFLQTDPIGYADQMNLYAYVGNDPVNKIDPSGESGCTSLPGVGNYSCSFLPSGSNQNKPNTKPQSPSNGVVAIPGAGKYPDGKEPEDTLNSSIPDSVSSAYEAGNNGLARYLTGKTGEEVAAEGFRQQGYEVYDESIRLDLGAKGVRLPDLAVRLPGNDWQYVEVKTNFSPLLKGQIMKDRHITQSYHTVTRGPDAGRLVPPRNVMLVRVWLF